MVGITTPLPSFETRCVQCPQPTHISLRLPSSEGACHCYIRNVGARQTGLCSMFTGGGTLRPPRTVRRSVLALGTAVAVGEVLVLRVGLGVVGVVGEAGRLGGGNSSRGRRRRRERGGGARGSSDVTAFSSRTTFCIQHHLPC